MKGLRHYSDYIYAWLLYSRFDGLVLVECSKLTELYQHFTDESLKELLQKLIPK